MILLIKRGSVHEIASSLLQKLPSFLRLSFNVGLFFIFSEENCTSMRCIEIYCVIYSQ